MTSVFSLGVIYSHYDLVYRYLFFSVKSSVSAFFHREISLRSLPTNIAWPDVAIDLAWSDLEKSGDARPWNKQHPS